MSTNPATIDYAALAAKAAEYEDQTEATSGGGDYETRIIPEGKTIGRLIEYIEFGVQPQKPYKGEAKKPCEEVRITFELLHPTKNIREIDVDGKKVTVADRISLTIPKSLSEKAKFYKLFKALAYGRSDIKHMAQCLNNAYIFDITNNEVEKDGKKVTYSNLNKDGSYQISAPFVVDPLTETKTDVPVGPAISPIRIFLWDHPSKETWNSLFIDGDREVTDAKGNKVKESKNWIQSKILASKAFPGSPLEDLLSGSEALTEALKETVEAEPVPTKTAAQKAKSTTKETKSTKAAKEETTIAADPLAALGLTSK